MDTATIRATVVDAAMPASAEARAALTGLASFCAVTHTLAHSGDAGDAILVGWEGPRTLDTVRRLAEEGPYAVIIVIADADSETAATTALVEGADEVLVDQDLSAIRLWRAIRNGLLRRKRSPDAGHRRVLDELERLIDRRTYELTTEIEERRAVELALLESEQRFRDFVTASSDWIWETDSAHRFTSVGGRVREVLGVDPGTLIGKTREEISAPVSDIEKLLRHREDLRARRPFRDYEYKYVTPDGRTLFLRTSGKPIHGADGTFLGYRGTATNSTAEILAEQRATEAQRQLYDAIESISEGFVLHDANGHLVLCNSKFKELYARLADVLVPGTPFATIARLGVERGQYMNLDCAPQEYVRRRLKQRAGPGCVFVQHLSDGRWVRVSERRTGDGGTVSIRTDITALRETEEKLLAAKEEAERANRTKSDFLANMSHELRTPLNAIMGFTETMCLEIFGPIGIDHYREYVNDIHVSATHLLGLINDLLDISKIEAGKFELYCERTAPATLLDGCIQLMRERAEAGGLVLTERIPACLPDIVADERRLKQVVLNLLANAIKFTPSGGSVTVEATVGGDGDFTITVNDTGIGMAQEDIPLALTAFGQVRSSYTRSQSGTGLGLPLSKRLIEMHGGSLSLDSVIGQGTTVTIWLPPERLVAI
ncbi:MAG: ATP-binding protein [Alphaproteobacteria bacterium]